MEAREVDEPTHTESDEHDRCERHHKHPQDLEPRRRERAAADATWLPRHLTLLLLSMQLRVGSLAAEVLEHRREAHPVGRPDLLGRLLVLEHIVYCGAVLFDVHECPGLVCTLDTERSAIKLLIWHHPPKLGMAALQQCVEAHGLEPALRTQCAHARMHRRVWAGEAQVPRADYSEGERVDADDVVVVVKVDEASEDEEVDPRLGGQVESLELRRAAPSDGVCEREGDRSRRDAHVFAPL